MKEVRLETLNFVEFCVEVSQVCERREKLGRKVLDLIVVQPERLERCEIVKCLGGYRGDFIGGEIQDFEVRHCVEIDALDGGERRVGDF